MDGKNHAKAIFLFQATAHYLGTYGPTYRLNRLRNLPKSTIQRNSDVFSGAFQWPMLKWFLGAFQWPMLNWFSGQNDSFDTQMLLSVTRFVFVNQLWRLRHEILTNLWCSSIADKYSSRILKMKFDIYSNFKKNWKLTRRTEKSGDVFVFHLPYDWPCFEYCSSSLNTSLWSKSFPSRNNSTLWSMPINPMYEFGLLMTVMSTSCPGVASAVDSSTVTCRIEKRCYWEPKKKNSAYFDRQTLT